MFKYTSTTILNYDKDVMSQKAMFSSIAAQGLHGAILRIKRDYTFEMPGITKVYKKDATLPTFAQVTVDCDALINAIPDALPSDPIYPIIGRLAFYIKLEGSEESVFANDFYQKGLPFSVGYKINSADTTGTELATQLAKNLTKFNVGIIGRPIFVAEASGSTLTITCIGEYSRFEGIAALLDLGIVEKEVVHYMDGEQDNDQTVFTLVARGSNGFGTFSHLMKDLRLPTATKTGWLALQKSDNPIPGALYNQYIIYYQAPSGTNPSLVGVGHETISKTQHIFWVNQNISDSFETVITEVVGSGPVKDDPTAIFEDVSDE